VASAAPATALTSTATSLLQGTGAVPNTPEAGANFPALLAALWTSPGGPDTGTAGNKQERPPKEEGSDQDGKRAALASSFLNIPPVPVDPRRPLPPEMDCAGTAPVQAKAAQIPDQRAPVPATRDSAAQLAFALVLQTPAKDDASTSNARDSDPTDGAEQAAPAQAVNKPMAELHPATVLSTKPGTHPDPLPIEPSSVPNSERRNDADQDAGSGSPRVLASPARIDPQTATFSFQQTQGGTPAQEAPAPHVENPHLAPSAAPEPALPGAQRPIQSLQIRLGEGSADAVQVQISEHAGNIHVSVRSDDPALTLPLRQNLPELVENLERHGYHADSVSSHEPLPASVLHSEVRSQTDQNQSWYGPDQGSRRQSGGEARNRKKRAGDANFQFPHPIQETNS